MLLKNSVVSLCIAVCGLLAQNAGAANYTVDGSHTSVIFGVSHLGYSFTYGRFNKVEGSFVFDKNDPNASTFEVTFHTTSVDTNDEKRDEHLKSPDFFDVRQFPKITFKTTQVSSTANEMQLTGNLTMHGVTKQVTIPLKYLGEGKGPYGNYRCGFSSRFTLKRSDFEMKGMIPHIGDNISILFSFEGIQNK